MDARQIALVRSSFIAACPISDELAEIFYENMFAVRPAMRALFPEDMDRQRRKLMDTLLAIVDDLDRPEAIRMAAIDLGRSHARYQVPDADYRIGEDALVAALAEMLQGAFSAEAEEAWRAAWGLFAGLMIREGERVRAGDWAA